MGNRWAYLYDKAAVPAHISRIEKLSTESQLIILRDPKVQAQFFEYHNCIYHDECWLWKGGYGTYGVFTVGRLNIAAHRASWIIDHRETIPPGFVVCHMCDVRSCVNPKHLFVGTQSANMQDMLAKGRGNRRGRKATISEEQVREIRKNTDSVHLVAKRMGLEYNVVYAARYGYSWSHLIDPLPWKRPDTHW